MKHPSGDLQIRANPSCIADRKTGREEHHPCTIAVRGICFLDLHRTTSVCQQREMEDTQSEISCKERKEKTNA
jgi:hypothetical protein